MHEKMTPGWELGKWLCICDRCGFKRVSSDMAREPVTELLVCRDTCWEPRHPQEFLKARPDNQAIPFVRPEPSNTFVDVTYADTGDHNDIPSGTFNNGL